MKRKKIFAIAGIILLVAALLVTVAYWYPRKELKRKMETAEKGEYITLVTLKEKKAEVPAFALKDSEIDGNMASGYLGGLSVDVYFDRKSDPEKRLNAYMQKCYSVINGLGYEVSDSSTQARDNVVLGTLEYSGIVDGEARDGAYYIYSVHRPGGDVVSYVLNQPLSQPDKKGLVALGDFLRLLEAKTNSQCFATHRGICIFRMKNEEVLLWLENFFTSRCYCFGSIIKKHFC